MPEETKKTRQVLHVRRFDTRESVRKIDVTGKSRSQVERVMRGMLINMNIDDFFIDDDDAYADGG
jgi:hypothetical protein